MKSSSPGGKSQGKDGCQENTAHLSLPATPGALGQPSGAKWEPAQGTPTSRTSHSDAHIDVLNVAGSVNQIHRGLERPETRMDGFGRPRTTY